MSEEVWKDIKGYEGWFMISNKGRIKSIKVNRHTHYPNVIKRDRFLSPFDNGHGYLVVSLGLNHTRKNHYVHRLVAEAFLEKVPGKDFVNHIDYDRKNNNVENLEWCTQRENVLHSSSKMRKVHNSKVGKSGQKYIRKISGKSGYRLKIRNCDFKIEKYFPDLKSAVIFRDKILKERNMLPSHGHISQ